MKYRFGAFEISEQTRELRCNGRLLPCQPKVFDLLVVLLQHRHQVVPRETLLREIWPAVAVSGGSINRLVKEARRRLETIPGTGPRIRTVRGCGYRFTGRVDCLLEPGEAREEDVLIARARRALEASLRNGMDDLQDRIGEFVSTCQLAVEAARSAPERTTGARAETEGWGR